ncbi:hypothetical protein CBS101457_002752 [Exobasidium rhododendri]|nr:hypothetical protein CBS101457_002752 [Exobasidium rhododendri]
MFGSRSFLSVTLLSTSLGSSSAMASLEAGTSSTTQAASSTWTAERAKKRIALQFANTEIWQNGPSPPSGSLDSNMKKNTGFIKRVRQSLGVESRDVLVKEVETLNLDKYVDEVIQAIPEGLSKCTTAKDCLAAAESLSALHRRFGGERFAIPLSQLLSSYLAVPTRIALQVLPADQRERDEQARVPRQKIMMRVVAELALVELTRQEKGKAKATTEKTEASSPTPASSSQEWLYLVLRDMLANDREHTNVPIVLSLLKVFGSTMFGSSTSEAGANDSSKGDVEQKMTSLSMEEDQLISKEMQARFRKLCETYYSTLSKRIVREHSRLQEQDKRNHEAYIKSGEIFEDRQQNYEKMSKSFEKLEVWGKKFSELIGLPMPELASDDKSNGMGLAINLDSRSSLTGNDRTDAEFALGKSPWEDEDTRRFYEDIVDLSELVPSSLLSSGQAKAKADEKAAVSSPQTKAEEVEGAKTESLTVASPEMPPADVIKEGSHGEKNENAEESAISAGPAAQLNGLLTRMPDMYNRAMIDSAAVDFAFLNSKMARKKLIKQLAALPRNRSDLIPHYARFVATLHPYMPDVGHGIMSVLDEEFRYFQRKRNVDLAESRAKNMRFIGELTKFQVAPLYTTFHCFKVCLDDFGGPNVENLATLLETCGRYLLRTPETSERMSGILELLRRKRATQNLDHRQLVLLDNAYYQCNPPEREAIFQKQYTPLQMYINHLIYDVLSKKTLDSVVKMLRKLPWKDEEALGTLHDVFLRSWRIRFSHLHLLAILLHELQAYHPDFTIYIIDGICENIRSGMETNIFKDNQRRVATTKYLGELYNYRLINSTIIFDQLWSFATFGHANGQPLPGQISSIDAPDDYFRIRLICTLLDACGQCFDRGVLRKKVDDYLLFLNIYVLSKVQPLPMDVDFMLSDTLEALRPHFHLKKSYEEAAQALDEMFAAQTAQAAAAAAAAAAATSNATTAISAPVEEEKDEDADDGMDSQSDLSEEESHRRRQKIDSDSESEVDDDEEGRLDDAMENGDEEGDDDDDEDDDEDDELVTRETQDNIVDQDAEDEFARDLAKMMAESNPVQSSAINRNQRGLFDVGMPFIKKNSSSSSSVGVAAATAAAAPLLPKEVTLGDSQHMRFSLLSKRGNKHQTHQVEVPIDSAIAVNSRANERQQQAERQQLKQLVLGIETREQTEDRKSLEEAIAKRGFRIKQGRE